MATKKQVSAAAAQQARLELLLYGPAGSGKTWFWRSAAEHVGWERSLVIYNERPIHTFEYHAYTKDEPWGVYDAREDSLSELTSKLVAPAARLAKAGTPVYDLVVYDGVTEGDLRGFANKEDEFGGSDKRQLWGDQLDDMLRLFWALEECGSHLIVTARMREFPDTRNPEVSVLRPAVRGQFGSIIDSRFDLVLFIENRGGKRSILLRPKGRVHIKTWEHVLPADAVEFIVEPWGTENAFAELLKICKVGG